MAAYRRARRVLARLTASQPRAGRDRAGADPSHEGFYGLIINAENLAVVGGVPCAAIKGLLKYRQIDAPKRPEKKVSSEGGREQ